MEDPTTHKRVPTVNRAQFTSIFDDEDYKSALQYADGYQKEVYEQEATVINEIQKQNVSDVYAAVSFAFFTSGLEKFDKLYEEGKLKKLYSTNLTYAPKELLERPWFVQVDMSKFIAKILCTLNNDESISPLLDSAARIRRLLKRYNQG